MGYAAGMTRPVRIEFAGALYHVTSRGDRREAIYEDDADRAQFLEILGEVVATFNRACHRKALRRYVAFVSEGIAGASIWRGLRCQIYLGDEAFVERMQAKSEGLSETLGVPKAHGSGNSQGNRVQRRLEGPFPARDGLIMGNWGWLCTARAAQDRSGTDSGDCPTLLLRLP